MSNPELQGESFLPAAATTTRRPVGGLMALALRRPGGRRAVSALTGLLCLGAVSIFAYPAITDLQQSQRHVTLNLLSPQFRDQYLSGHVRIGEGLTRLVIDNPRVQVNVVVVEGTSVAALQAGAGHYPSTPYPCAPGNVAIAGHRTTYGRPFNRINDMQVGDTVKLFTPIGDCVYQVVPGFAGHANPWIVSPNDTSVISQAGSLGAGHWLTLTSCNPPGSDTQRIVLRLKMIWTSVHVALPPPTTGQTQPSTVQGGS